MSMKVEFFSELEEYYGRTEEILPSRVSEQN